MHIKNKGFTLIELLVVIAIIGILASVVLASLNTARAKGADAAIKSNLNNARSQAELFYDTYANPLNTYTAVCTATNGIAQFVTAATSAGGTATCADTGGAAYRVSSPLKTSATSYYCVDSTGKAITTATAPSGTACPAS